MDSESDYPPYFYTCVNVSFIETSTIMFVLLQLLITKPLLTFTNSTALYFLRVLRSLFLRIVSRKNHICLATTQLRQLFKPFSEVSPSSQSSPPCGQSSMLDDVNRFSSALLFKLPVPSLPAWLDITTPMWRV